MEAARKSWAWRLGTLILLLERQAFTNVPTAQFTHFVHELASSTSQSLLGAAPPNPCLHTFTNVLHANVYLIFFFQGIPLKILLPVSFKISLRSSNLVKNSITYPQNNLSSTSPSLIQFRTKNSHFHSRSITQLFYRYGYSSSSIVDLL